jgi:hypothetical protein
LVDSYPLNLSQDWYWSLEKTDFAIKSKSSGQYLAIDKWTSPVPTPQTRCTFWRLKPAGEGYFALMNNTTCLQAAADGLNVSLGKYIGSDSQKWRFKPVCNGQYAICVKSSNKCLVLMYDADRNRDNIRDIDRNTDIKTVVIVNRDEDRNRDNIRDIDRNSRFSSAFQLEDYQGYADQEFYITPKKSSQAQSENSKTNYKVWVYTGDDDGAGTNANIWIDLHGPLDNSNKCDRMAGNMGGIQIGIDGKKDYFEEGNVDELELKDVTDVGDISEIVIYFDPHGTISKEGPWKLNKIKVLNTKTGETYTFLYDKWMVNDGDYTIPSDRAPPKRLANYKVKVYTGNDSSAGTNAAITIDLIGLNDKSGRYASTGSQSIGYESKYFEKGNADEFELKDVTDVGDIIQISIGVDKWDGLMSSRYPLKLIRDDPWQLIKVEVVDEKTGKKYTFSYDNVMYGGWIKTDGPHTSPIDYYPNLPRE